MAISFKENTILKEAKCSYEAHFGNSTVVRIVTDYDNIPISFRISRHTDVSGFHVTALIQWLGVHNTDELVGKKIKVVLDANDKIIGYGSPNADMFILVQDERFNFYNWQELVALDTPQNCHLMVRDF